MQENKQKLIKNFFEAKPLGGGREAGFFAVFGIEHPQDTAGGKTAVADLKQCAGYITNLPIKKTIRLNRDAYVITAFYDFKPLDGPDSAAADAAATPG